LLYATARKPDSKIILSSICLPFVDYGLSLLSAMSLFAFLGHVAYVEDTEVKNLTSGGLDLAFIAYPGLMTTLTMSNFWSLMFFLMLLFIGIDTLFGMFDFVTAYVWDFFDLKGKVKKQYLVLLILAIMLIINMMFVTNYGWYFYVFLSKHVGGFSLVFVLLGETFTIGYLFGFEKLDAVMKFKTGETVPKSFILSIKYIAVPSMTVILIASFLREVSAGTDEELWQVWGGRFIISVPIISCLLGLCIKRKTPTAEALVERQYGKPLWEIVEDYRFQLEKTN